MMLCFESDQSIEKLVLATIKKKYSHICCYVCESVAAAGLSKSGSSFSANIIKIVHLFIRKFCSSFSRKCSSLLYV